MYTSKLSMAIIGELLANSLSSPPPQVVVRNQKSSYEVIGRNPKTRNLIIRDRNTARSKYMPHQGKRECARRIKQIN